MMDQHKVYFFRFWALPDGYMGIGMHTDTAFYYAFDMRESDSRTLFVNPNPYSFRQRFSMGI